MKTVEKIDGKFSVADRVIENAQKTGTAAYPVTAMGVAMVQAAVKGGSYPVVAGGRQ